jgi:hypothetical protein
MTSELSRNRLADILDDLAGSGRYDYTASILGLTSTTRQRPAWRFPARWLPLPELVGGDAIPLGSRAGSLALLLVLAMLLTVFAALQAGRRQSVPAPFGPAHNGALVFANGGQLFIADGPASTPRVFVDGPEQDNLPIFSPSGKRLLFLRRDAGTADGPSSLMVTDADGARVDRLTEPIEGLNGIAWLPDGSGIAFGQEVLGEPRIVTYPVDHRPATVLELGLPAGWPAWRPPNGAQVAFLGRVDDSWTVHVSNADGTQSHDLGVAGREPAWSPDGSRLVVDTGGGPTTGVTRGGRLHLLDIDASGRPTRDTSLEFDARNDAEMRAIWSPDGSRLAFIAARDGRFILAIGNTDGTGYREIGVPSTSDASLNSVWSWSPDGSVVVQTFDDGATWLLDPGGDAPREAPFGPGAFTTWQRTAP